MKGYLWDHDYLTTEENCSPSPMKHSLPIDSLAEFGALWTPTPNPSLPQVGAWSYEPLTLCDRILTVLFISSQVLRIQRLPQLCMEDSIPQHSIPSSCSYSLSVPSSAVFPEPWWGDLGLRIQQITYSQDFDYLRVSLTAAHSKKTLLWGKLTAILVCGHKQNT